MPDFLSNVNFLASGGPAGGQTQKNNEYRTPNIECRRGAQDSLLLTNFSSAPRAAGLKKFDQNF
jgi:hypothetical protein